MHNLYYPVYKNLENEVVDLAYKIHFADDQLKVYSIKIAELLLRCCVEIEAIAKDLYLSNDGKIEKDTNGNEKHLSFDKKCLGFLEEKWILSKKIVYTSSPNFYFIEDANKILTPLDKASIRGKEGSEWKYAYQKVKHNRSQNIKDANVENLIHAMAALYLLNIYYKDEKPKYMGKSMSLENFDNTIGSSLFSVAVQPLTYSTAWEIMHGDERSVYVEKFLDNDYGQLLESIIKQNYDFLSNSNGKPLSFLQAINNAGLVLENKENKPLFNNSSFEVVLNKNQEIYPIRNWAHPITGMPYELQN